MPTKKITIMPLALKKLIDDEPLISVPGAMPGPECDKLIAVLKSVKDDNTLANFKKKFIVMQAIPDPSVQAEPKQQYLNFFQYAAYTGKFHSFMALINAFFEMSEEIAVDLGQLAIETMRYVILGNDIRILTDWFKYIIKNSSLMKKEMCEILMDAIIFAINNSRETFAEELTNFLCSELSSLARFDSELSSTDVSSTEFVKPSSLSQKYLQPLERLLLLCLEHRYIKTFHSIISIIQNKLADNSVGLINNLLIKICAADNDDKLIIKFLHCLPKNKLNLVSIFDERGLSLLHLAAYKGKRHTLSYLISEGCNPNIPTNDPNHCLPIHLLIDAIINKKIGEQLGIKAMHALYECGADINATDGYGATPLYLLDNSESKKELALTHSELSKLGGKSEKLSLAITDELSSQRTVNLAPISSMPLTASNSTPVNNIKYLVLKGGGVKGLAYVGALEALENMEHMRLSNLDGVGGTSAGAIAALLIALGYSVNELKQTLWRLDFSQFIDIPGDTGKNRQLLLRLMNQDLGIWTMISNLGNICSTLKNIAGSPQGICEGEVVRQWLIGLINSKLQGTDFEGKGESITFAQLAEIKKDGVKLFKDLRIVALNLTKKRSEVSSAQCTPNRRVVDAARMSFAIPGIFSPVVIDNNQYVDGGVFDNYPIHIFDEEDGPNSHVLGLALVSDKHKQEFQGSDAVIKPEHTKLTQDGYFLGIKGLIDNVKACITEKQNSDHVQRSADRARTIYIDNCGISTINFALTELDKSKMYTNSKKDVYLALNHLEIALPPLSAQSIRTLLYYEVITQDPFQNVIRLRKRHILLTPQQIYKIYAEAKSTEILHLLRYVNPNERDANGNTALHYAYAHKADCKLAEQALQNLHNAFANEMIANVGGIIPVQAPIGKFPLADTENPWLIELRMQNTAATKLKDITEKDVQILKLQELIRTLETAKQGQQEKFVIATATIAEKDAQIAAQKQQIYEYEPLYDRPKRSLKAKIPTLNIELQQAINEIIKQADVIAASSKTDKDIHDLYCALSATLEYIDEKIPYAKHSGNKPSYQEAINNTFGRESLQWKILGMAMLTLGLIVTLGGILIAAGVAATLIPTLGTSAIAAPLAIGCISGGTTLSAVGSGFFYRGKQKSLAKTMEQLVIIKNPRPQLPAPIMPLMRC